MPRPKKCRFINCKLNYNFFKPFSVPLRDLEIITLNLDEVEAIRLKDLKGLKDQEASELMKISQPTFNRILNSARIKISKAIIEGSALKIEQNDKVLSNTDKRSD